MHQPAVEIKKPCFETLENSKPGELGNYCKVCRIAVVDFTTYTPKEIALYLSTHKGQHLCGTFNSTDVKSDHPIDKVITYLQSRKLRFFAFLIIGLLILTGCRTRKGKVSYTTGRFNENANSKTKTEHLD